MKLGTVFWITGLSGAGKSTLAKELQCILQTKGVPSIILDGDELREVFSKNSTSQNHFSREMRLQLAMQYSRLACLLSSQGFNVIVATISMFNEIYENNRALICNYIEIFIDTPMNILRDRDTKGIYQKQSNGALLGVAGVDLPIDIPPSPDIKINFQIDCRNYISVNEILSLWEQRNAD